MIDKELTPTEKLDAVLSVFNFDDDNFGIHGIEVNKRLKDKNLNLGINIYVEILHKLEKDGYIRVEHREAIIQSKMYSEASFYLLTFEGDLFKTKGGYHQMQEDKTIERALLKSEMVRNRWINSLLVFGTILAGIGAIALVIWEIYKYFYLHIR